jgi:predicted dienelactone hydrolase
VSESLDILTLALVCLGFARNKNMIFRFFPGKIAIFLFSLGVSLISFRVIAAEKIILEYGPLEFSISVKSLENYAKTGKIDRQLANYAHHLTPEQLQKFQEILQTKVDLDHVVVANFLNSFQGEIILKKLGEIIKTNQGINGFYAIRGALILAAVDENGLTPLNILKKFPTSQIRISSEEGLQVFNLVTNTIQDTTEAIASIGSQAQTEMSNQKISLYGFTENLSQQGESKFSVNTFRFKDLQRNRILPIDLYQPEVKNAPLIIISHGLGSDRTTFAYLAQHLASWGFAVAVLEHPGSNAAQIEALLSGLANTVTPPRELIDRPLDIKFVLNELNFLYGKEINVRQVGIIGQSFGGYTSLALAGAQLNWKKLKDNCQINNNNYNGSLLLQCLALQLPQQDYDLKDERIVAVMAINPLTSVIFGEENLSQISIPLMMMSGSDDTVTPALQEQIKPFTWLTTGKKYLVLMKKGTHFSTLNESSTGIPLPPQAIGPDPTIAQTYVKALSVGFFKTYVAKQTDYDQYLNANYAQYLSKFLMPLNLVTSLESIFDN